MLCQAFCSSSMWSKIRRKVLKNKSYELQANAPFTDLDDEDVEIDGYDKNQGSPSKRENRRSANGFAKCLIPHLSSGPIGCACKKNISPGEGPSGSSDKLLDSNKNKNGKESKKWSPEDKKSNSGKSKGEEKSLNYYFKETDSCELVRKNKSTTTPTQGKANKNKNVDKHVSVGSSKTSQMPNKKSDNNVMRPTSMKDKSNLPLFPAGQRDAKSGLDFKEFQRAFESQETIGDQTKTVTFGTFGKDIPDSEPKKVTPPLFQPIRTKKNVEESCEIPIISNPTLLSSSLSSSSKGASLTSEEGVESGYGTQDDGNDRLARSISSNSDCNNSDFQSDVEKLVCGISRESTGEEDVFHHAAENTPIERANKETKDFLNPSVTRANKTVAMATTTGFNPVKVSPNKNIVVAEVHAENSDDPKPTTASTMASWLAERGKLIDKFRPQTGNDQHNNNKRQNISGRFDVNCNPQREKATTTAGSTLFPILKPKKISMTELRRPEPIPDMIQTQTSSSSSLQTTSEADSDEEDIREYLPADVSSMSEVYNQGGPDRRGLSGSGAVNELYASVPKCLDDGSVENTTMSDTTTLDNAKCAPGITVEEKILVEKKAPRPDVIDCHDVSMEPMVTEPPPLPDPPPQPISPDGSEEDTIHLDYDNESFSEAISEDGDSGPPLPTRNYSQNSQTLLRESENWTKLETQRCEAPTLVIRRKTPEKDTTPAPSLEAEASSVTPSESATASSSIPESSPSPSSSRIAQDFADSEEITTIEEPIHMTWEEVMKEAKSLGIPLSPPAMSQTLDRRASLSSQDSSTTPVASPVKRPGKVKRSHSEAKKSRSPFKEKFKLQNLFTLRKSKAESAKSSHSADAGSKTTERLYNRRSMPASSYDTTDRGSSGMSTTPREHSRMSKSCVCATPESTYRVTSPMKYTYYTHHTPHHHHHMNLMNVSINVSVISAQSNGSGTEPPSPGPDTPQSPDSVGTTNPMTRSLLSHHSMSNHSLSQQSVFSGHSSYSYQSAHSATSIGSPNTQQRKPNKGGTPSNSPSYHGNNGVISQCDTTGTFSNGYYGSTTAAYNAEAGGGGNGNADFIGSLLKLKDCGWYWGPLGWDDAESKLANKPDGSFLVRDSSDDRYILSLSFRSQGTTHHTRIEHYKGMFSFYSQPKSHGAATIVEFIEKAMEHSRNGKFLYFLRPRAPGLPPAPVQLLYPVSRLQNMQTLQHMCRFVILKQVRKDHIDRLPIPPRLKEYLKQNQYYTEYLGGDLAAPGECLQYPTLL